MDALNKLDKKMYIVNRIFYELVQPEANGVGKIYYLFYSIHFTVIHEKSLMDLNIVNKV